MANPKKNVLKNRYQITAVSDFILLIFKKNDYKPTNSNITFKKSKEEKKL